MRYHSEASSGSAGTGRIYLDFYGLSEPPFSITPDPQFLFMAKTHQNALDKITYGIESRMGFIVLTGETGTGKTTICRFILDQIGERAKSVYIINPSLSGRELISSILDDLGISYSETMSKKEMIGCLNGYLLSGQARLPLVIIIDDAQTMPVEALEELRLLSNLESDKEKYIQMVLAGQPELMALLSRPELRQLKQRVAVKCHLEYLTREETGQYILRRMISAGDNGRVRFTPEAIRRIHKISKGIPRLVNKVCDYMLIAGYVSNSFTIFFRQVKMALADIEALDFSNDTFSFKNFWKAHPIYKWSASFVTAVLILGLSFFLRIDRTILSGVRSCVKQQASNALQPPLVAAIKFPVPEAGTEETLHSLSPAGKEEEPAVVVNPEEDIQSDPEAHPYILQLATYKDLGSALQAVPKYKDKTDNLNWQQTDNDKNECWYRLVSGRFKTGQEALDYKQARGLDDAIVSYSPWTVQIGEVGPSEGLVPFLSILRENGYDGCLIQKPGGLHQLCSGTFRTLEKAETAARKLQKLTLTAAPVLQ